VPLQCEFLALEGLSLLVRTVERVQQSLNPGLTIQGIVLTMYDTRNNLSALIASDVRSYFGDKVYATVIPRNVRVSEAPSHGKPVLLYDVKCPGSQAYIHLAGELLRREGGVAPPSSGSPGQDLDPRQEPRPEPEPDQPESDQEPEREPNSLPNEDAA
jgi:chromosome partitioning protein